MNTLPNLNKAVKPSGIIQRYNTDTRLRWISKEAVSVGKYYYVFLRTVGREYEPGLPEEQADGVWLIGKVNGVLGGNNYPRSYRIEYTHALRWPAFGSGAGEGAPAEYEPLEEGPEYTINYAHIQSPSEPGLPPERTVARFYIPEQGGGRRRRRTGRKQRKQRRLSRRRHRRV